MSDDLRPVYEIVMDIFGELGIQIITFQRFQKEFDLPYMNFYSRYTDAKKETLDAMFVRYAKTAPPAKPMQGALDTLRELERRKIPMAVVSSVPATILKEDAKRYGFLGFFVGMFGSVHDKTDALVGAAMKVGFDVKKTGYVGDMTHDIEAAKAAGMISIVKTDGYHTKEKLQDYPYDIMIDSIRELPGKVF